MMTDDTFYRPIADIDLPEFAHLKDGRPVLVLDPVWEPPLIAEWSEGWQGYGWHLRPTGQFRLNPTHFSAHDPAPDRRAH